MALLYFIMVLDFDWNNSEIYNVLSVKFYQIIA